jgi:hypothetical protein
VSAIFLNSPMLDLGFGFESNARHLGDEAFSRFEIDYEIGCPPLFEVGGGAFLRRVERLVRRPPAYEGRSCP